MIGILYAVLIIAHILIYVQYAKRPISCDTAGYFLRSEVKTPFKKIMSNFSKRLIFGNYILIRFMYSIFHDRWNYKWLMFPQIIILIFSDFIICYLVSTYVSSEASVVALFSFIVLSSNNQMGPFQFRPERINYFLILTSVLLIVVGRTEYCVSLFILAGVSAGLAVTFKVSALTEVCACLTLFFIDDSSSKALIGSGLFLIGLCVPLAPLYLMRIKTMYRVLYSMFMCHYDLFRKMTRTKDEACSFDNYNGVLDKIESPIKSSLLYLFLKNSLMGVAYFKPWCFFFLTSWFCFLCSDIFVIQNKSPFYGLMIFIILGGVGHIIQTESMSAFARGMWLVPFMLTSVFFFDCIHKNFSLTIAILCYLFPLILGIKKWMMLDKSVWSVSRNPRWKMGLDLEKMALYMKANSWEGDSLFVAGSSPELYVISGLREHVAGCQFLRSISYLNLLRNDFIIFNDFLLNSGPTFIVCDLSKGFEIDSNYLKNKHGLVYSQVTSLSLGCDHLKLYKLQDGNIPFPDKPLGKAEVLKIIIPAKNRFGVATETRILHYCCEWSNFFSKGKKAAIYGGGAHTEGLLHICSDVLNINTVKAVIDRAPSKEIMDDIPMVRADVFDYDSVDFIIISSNAYEQEIYDFLLKKIPKERIKRIYG